MDEIKAARRNCGWSQRFLAERVGRSAQSIKRLENGVGSVETLVAVVNALDFQLTGIGPGLTLADQLRRRREKMGWSRETTGKKCGLSPTTVLQLEAGGGSISSLMKLMAKLAPKVRRRAPERAYWGAGDKADRDSRFTPPEFLETIYTVFGKPDLDPCGHKLSPVKARRRFVLEEGDDGLRDPWSGRMVFVNPPFSEQQKWLRRAHEQWEKGNVLTVVCLVPTRTDSAWFHEVLARDGDVFFLQGRLRFSDPRGKSQVTPHSVMLVLFGASSNQRDKLAASLPGRWMSTGG
ncbi:MAG: hypothetical protein CL808_00025 [Citromicrobium sp.]|nr:hypothetical protein [Citromicrobium sp.]